jgi:anti-anti-sigma regulatory factor
MRAGASVFDNGAAEPTRPSDSTTARSEIVAYGEAADGTRFLALRGRATWQHCDAFYRTALGILDERHPLVIDLSRCDYLDSTCLGALHELVAAGNVRLHGLQPAVRELFEELDMRQVLASVDGVRDVPELFPLTARGGGSESARNRIRQAHETLASLSERNAERFRSVLEGMRADPHGR